MQFFLMGSKIIARLIKIALNFKCSLHQFRMFNQSDFRAPSFAEAKLTNRKSGTDVAGDPKPDWIG